MTYEPIMDDGGLTEPLQGREPGAVIGSQYCLQKAQQFTLENAIFGRSWSITDPNGQEVYRVRGKRVQWCRPQRQLLDLDGNLIVSMTEKCWTWKRTWRAFEPGGNPELPLFTVKRLTFCGFKPRMSVFLPSNRERKIPDYSIIGNCMLKKSIIYFGDQKVAEVVRDASLKNILTCKSIFHVLVQPGVDAAFIFSLIVIMDKLYIHDNYNYYGGAGGYS